MPRAKDPITEQEFERLKITLFSKGSFELKTFGKRLMDHCWMFDRYAVSQAWQGQRDRLIVFGIPKKLRSRSNAKNYFSIYAVNDSSDESLQCEVILSRTDRDEVVRRIDPRRTLRVSTIGEMEGHYKPDDFDYLAELIEFARNARMGAEGNV